MNRGIPGDTGNALTWPFPVLYKVVPGASPRAEVADSLLDSVVLTVSDATARVEVNLRQLSALVRMGFLEHDSHVAVDVAGRWLRHADDPLRGFSAPAAAVVSADAVAAGLVLAGAVTTGLWAGVGVRERR